MHCIQALIPTCASKQGHEMKMKTQQKVSKMVAQDMSIYGMMFRKRSHVSTKFTQMTYVKSSDLIKPPEEFFQKHLLQIPPSLRLAVEKMQVIEQTPTSAKPWSAPACSARRPLTLRPRLPSQPPKTYSPSATSLHTDVWSQRAAGAVPLGDSWLQRLAWRKWPRCFEETSKPIIRNRCAKSNHDSGSTKNGVGHVPAIYLNSCFSDFLASPLSLRRV